MSKRGQEATSSEGSPIAKPNQWFQRRRDPSTWCHAVRGARGKILRRVWENWSTLGNADEGQGSQTGTRTTQSPEVESSKVRRQEKAQNSNPWKQDDREVSSYSTGTRKRVRTATPRTEFHYMKYTNHQYITKIFHFIQKKLGIAAQYSTFSMEALKTNVLIR